MNRRARGTSGENLAVEFLEKKGYRILERNYYFARGEIDIIADDRGTLVFIEVKARRSSAYGEPEEAISMRKRRQLRKVAQGYLYTRKIEDRECRFDVVAIKYLEQGPEIRHLENAF